MKNFADDSWLAPWHHVFEQRRHRVENIRATLGTSLSDYAQGHKYFGLHRNADGSMVYRDWAPNATALALIGDFSSWEERAEYFASPTGYGCWELVLPPELLKNGDHYRVRMHWHGGQGDRLPAWGRRIVQDSPSGLFSAQVWEEPEFVWQHQAPVAKAPPMIYEAHVGMSSELGRISTWDEFRQHMLPRIAGAGYNT
ncbi:MAG: 1,4-alpha-glucan-branching enzyme, partial [Verrucomicrobia bacterium]|nr:1,4-alpha-glucan-branching enzyme [Verrucomicrobiota bacterium]